MVFGNCGNRSGAGVAFSRNPATGANEPYVDFLFDAQGEESFPAAARQATPPCWRSGYRISPEISPSRRGDWSKN
jgi:hypothetical protein